MRVIALPQRLDMNAAINLAEELRPLAGVDVTLDAAETTHVGTLCLQTIFAAATAFAAAGHRLRLANVSDAAIDQLRLLGFTPEALEAGADA